MAQDNSAMRDERQINHTELRRYGVDEFARRLKFLIETNQSRLVWFLGAGCSVSSGVPAAGDLARRWISDLQYMKTGTREESETWAAERYPHYDPSTPAKVYADVFAELFPTEQDRQRAMERLVAQAEPGFGYVTLAQLIAHEIWGERCNAVFSVNFDDLLADALYMFGHKKPQVWTHRSLDRRTQITGVLPTIFKIFGDAHLGDDYGDDNNRRLLDRNVKERLRAQVTEATLIFMGYGGADDSAADLFEGLPKGAPSGGVYWVNSELPRDAHLQRWIERSGTIWVKEADFDRVMYAIREEFALEGPDTQRMQTVIETYKAYYSTAASARKDAGTQGGGTALIADEEALGKSKPEAESESASIGNSEDAARLSKTKMPSLQPTGGSQVSHLIAAAVQAMSAPDRATQDASTPANESGLYGSLAAVARDAGSIGSDSTSPPERTKHFLSQGQAVETDRQFRDALQRAPENAELMARYAEFLAIGRRDYDGAEHYFKRALDMELQNAVILRSYAGFLAHIRKDFDEAEKLYRLALTVKLRSPRTLSDYAEFLSKARGDLDAAEDAHRLAADIDPRNGDAICAYAWFLAEKRGNIDAAFAMLKAAAQTEYGGDRVRLELARFLIRFREDRKAILETLNAVSGDHAAEALLIKANYIASRSSDTDSAEVLYQQAIKANPHSAKAHAAYSAYLAGHKFDAKQAEVSFARAYECDPGDEQVIPTYARYLAKEQGKTAQAEKILLKAVQYAPRNAALLTAHAEFMAEERNDFATAEASYQQAMEAEPHNAEALLSYARFLANKQAQAEQARKILRRALIANPHHPSVLAELASLSLSSSTDPAQIRALFDQALAAAPHNASIVARYGSFLHIHQRDFAAATKLYEQALDASGAHPRLLTGRAAMELISGESPTGLALLDKAFSAAMAAPPQKRDSHVLLELWFYRYAFTAPPDIDALRSALSLVRDGTRLARIQLQDAAKAAIDRGHSEPDILEELLAVIAGESPAGSLESGLKGVR